jgi:hypothetical protein
LEVAAADLATAGLAFEADEALDAAATLAGATLELLTAGITLLLAALGLPR